MHDNRIPQQISGAKLLRTGGCPGKIYLDGFLPHEFVKLTNLLTLYGGVVVSPDDETIILSKTKDLSHSKYYPRFDVQWLHDSIMKNQLQDIGNYLLPLQIPHAPKNVEQKLPLVKPKLSNSPLTSPRTTHDKTSSKPLKTESPLSRKSSGSSSGYQPSGDAKKKHRDSPRNGPHLPSTTVRQKSLPANLKKASETQNDQPFVKIEKKKRSRSIPDEALPDLKRIKSSPSSANGSVTKSPEKTLQEKGKKSDHKRQDSLNLAENGNDDDLPGNEKALALKDSDNANDVSSVVEPSNAFKDDQSSEHGENEKHQQDGTCEEKGETADKENEYNNVNCNEGEKSQLNKSGNSSGTATEVPSKKRYSTQENKKIMQYLTENNMLDGPIPRGTWHILAREFQDPPRTPMSIWMHFRRVLLPNLKGGNNNRQISDDQEKQERKKLKNLIGHLHNLPEPEDASDDD